MPFARIDLNKGKSAAYRATEFLDCRTASQCNGTLLSAPAVFKLVPEPLIALFHVAPGGAEVNDTFGLLQPHANTASERDNSVNFAAALASQVGTNRVSFRLLKMPCRARSRLNSISCSRPAAYFESAKSCTSMQRPVAPPVFGLLMGMRRCCHPAGRMAVMGEMPCVI